MGGGCPDQMLKFAKLKICLAHVGRQCNGVEFLPESLFKSTRGRRGVYSGEALRLAQLKIIKSHKYRYKNANCSMQNYDGIRYI